MSATDYPNALAAAQSAADATAELLRAIREEDAIDIDQVLGWLVDATKNVIEIELRDSDNQLLGAIEKWIGENR